MNISLAILAVTWRLLAPWEVPPEISIDIGFSQKSKFESVKYIKYPIAFKIQNVGKSTILGSQVSTLFFRGKVHVSKGRLHLTTDMAQRWRGMTFPLKPDATTLCSSYENILDYFPGLKDGTYDLWWTCGDLTSSKLRFKIVDHAVTSGEPK